MNRHNKFNRNAKHTHYKICAKCTNCNAETIFYVKPKYTLLKQTIICKKCNHQGKYHFDEANTMNIYF